MAGFAHEVKSAAPASEIMAQLMFAREYDAQGQSERALETLRRAAATGDAAAKSALGLHLLTRPPIGAEEGAKLTEAAAAEGNAEAAYLMAVLSSGGLIVPQSWRVALLYLQQAAERGHARARAELALLAGEPEVAADGGILDSGLWERLRRKIDVRTWLITPKARVTSTDPRIAVAENFIAPWVCDWLIERSRPNLKLATTDDPATGGARYGSNRTNSSAEFALTDIGVVLHLLRARISAIASPPTSAMEGSCVLHYVAGQQFFPHYDFLDPAEPGYAKQVAEHGQRVLTFLIYLNADFEGGETHFPIIDWRYKGKKGDGLLFWNVQASGQPDRQTLHAGLPPTRGEKWLFSQWVRGRIS